MKRNSPRASHCIRIALFISPEAPEATRKICVTLGNASRRARLFDPIIKDAAKRHQVDPALVKAIIMAESGYNPFAISHKGAQGLMQLMPETARDLGVENSFNPAHNVNGGVRYIKQLLKRFNGDVTLALAAYNAGMARVLEHRGVPPYEATQAYVRKVLSYYEYFRKAGERKKNA
ncbi:MAG: lytic transglycosylase domain-containing protein [Deltaproteobacteria bacterium]|nr:lytic transglycosylase domain-containing protein [Deltaproteobacteria bacterium]